jgi:sRNA-binding carbon storage regulator CsrA
MRGRRPPSTERAGASCELAHGPGVTRDGQPVSSAIVPPADSPRRQTTLTLERRGRSREIAPGVALKFLGINGQLQARIGISAPKGVAVRRAEARPSAPTPRQLSAKVRGHLERHSGGEGHRCA